VLIQDSALYLSLALYKWNEYVVVGEIKEAAATNRVVRRTHAGRRLSPLLALFVRDEAAVFLILACESWITNAGATLANADVTGLQLVAAVFMFVPKLRMYGGAIFQLVLYFSRKTTTDSYSRWFIAAMSICVSPLTLSLQLAPNTLTESSSRAQPASIL
jgi:hypothetical protein